MIRAKITKLKKCFGCTRMIIDSLAGTRIFCVWRTHLSKFGGAYHTQHEVCPECYRRERG